MELLSQAHLIERQVFEVEFYSRAQAHQLQDRLIKLYNDRIMAALAVLFNRLVLPEVYVNLSELTVDIGRFSENWEDDELLESIITAVEEALLLLISRSSRNVPKPEFNLLNISGHKPFQLLDHFLLHGSLPWWAAGDENPEWSALLARLFVDFKMELKSGMLKAGKLKQVRLRMAYQFNDEAIYLVLQLIEPDHADYIRLFHSDLVLIQQEEQVVKTDIQAFKGAIWEFILDYLLIENKSFFNKLQFVEATLIRFAAHFNLSYARVLALFVQAIPTASRGLTTDLPELLWMLSKKNNPETGFLNPKKYQERDHVIPHRLKSKVQREEMGLIGYYLCYGHLPAWAEDEKLHLSTVAGLFQEMIGSSADLAIKLIKYLGTNELARYRFLMVVSGESLITGISKVFSGSGKGYAAFLYLIDKLSELFTKTDLLQIEKILASVFLTELDAAHYTDFKVGRFFAGSIPYVSAFAGLSPDQLIKQLLPAVDKAQILAFDLLLLNLLADQGFLVGGLLPNHDFYELLQQSDSAFFSDSWLNDHLVYRSQHSDKESYKVLHYFLQHGHLPGQYGFTENEAEQLFLNLSDYIQQHWFSLDASAPILAKGALKAILNKSGRGQGKTVSPGDAAKALGILSDLFKTSQNIPDGWIVNDSQLALRAIRHFMSTGALPSHYAFSNAREELALLRQLLKIANKGHQLGLSEIFIKAAFQEQAIVKLLKLVYLPEEDGEISKVLEHFMDRQLLNAFTNWGFDHVMSNQELNILAVFSDVNENRTKAFLELMAHSQLRTYMARKSSIVDVLKIMDRQYAAWNGEELAASKGVYYWMAEQLQDSLEKEHLATLFKEFFLMQLLSKDRFTDATSFFRAFLKFLSSRRDVIFRQLLEGSASVAAGQVLSVAVPKLVSAEIARFSKAFLAHERVEKDFLEAEFQLLSLDGSSLSEAENSFSESAPFEPDFEGSGASFLIGNAGLVLLHPYLKTFFVNLGLVKEGKFISKRARFKAIHVLQFLMDGELEHPEHMLTLNKLLCGWPINAAVPLSISLSEAERQACEDFIAAVISMWEQMKNSSHANFRGSFLMREGLLRKEQEDWSLRVAPRAYDVLLQSLPWGYSVVNNSLMDTIIYVEWI